MEEAVECGNMRRRRCEDEEGFICVFFDDAGSRSGDTFAQQILRHGRSKVVASIGGSTIASSIVRQSDGYAASEGRYIP